MTQNNSKLFAQLKKLHTISAKRPPKKKAPVATPAPTLPSTLPQPQIQLPQPQTQPPQPQLYGQYSGLTSISPTFGQPQGAGAGNRTAMNSPSSQWKAQITKDTMKGLQDYNTPKQAYLNDDEGWGSYIEDSNTRAQYDKDLKERADYSKAPRISGGSTSDSPNVMWDQNPQYSAVADVAASGGFGGGSSLLKHLKNSLYYLRNPLTGAGLSSTAAGAGKGMISPTHLLRGLYIASPLTDAIGWRADSASANTLFENAHSDWVEAGGHRSGRPEPNVETFYENLTATRGDYLLDSFARNKVTPSTGVVDNFIWKNDPRGDLGWFNQIGGNAGQTANQALGQFLGRHSYDSMGRSARKPMGETLDTNSELVRNNPAYLASLIYGNKDSDDSYDFSNMRPPMRDYLQEAYWRNDQNKQLDEGNFFERYVTNPISKWVADPTDRYANTTSRIITNTLEQVHRGKMTPEQRQHILSRIGVDVASEEVAAEDREYQAYLNKKDNIAVERHMAEQGRLANRNKEDQAGTIDVKVPQ